MSYAVKEIFYTLQGEGANVGRPAVFCRFTGCNLWSGREVDRDKGPGSCSRWCDTDFFGVDGTGGGHFEDPEQLADSVASYWPGRVNGAFVVCTGGEPLLQLDTPLIAALHSRGFEIAIETNGTRKVPTGIDWTCVSPKAGAELFVRSGNEFKLVFPQWRLDPEQFRDLKFEHFFLQPMDGADVKRNLCLAVRYCLEHPGWRLSLQVHKFIGIR